MLVFHISKPITATYASLTYQGLQGILIFAYIPFLISRCLYTLFEFAFFYTRLRTRCPVYFW